MKLTFAIISGLLLGVSVFGSNPLTFPLLTPGPDTYADGSQVLVGETYLLVYLKPGAEFKGVLMDGTLVDPTSNVIAAKGYAVAGAKCGFKAIQYAPELYPEDGKWIVVLLDTRNASGEVGGLVAAVGASVTTTAPSVNSTCLSALNASATGDGTTGLTALTQSQAPADTPVPVITAVERGNGTANVRFSNFKSGTLYSVESKTDLSSGTWQPASNGARVSPTPLNVVLGAGGTPELPVAVQMPVNDQVRFFRVIVGSK